MALEVHDRVKETTTTTGSSDAYALGGAVTGFETFGSHLGDADTTYYVCTDGTNFEIGRGTYNTSANTLTRTAVLASSNSGNDNAHSWASGTKEIFITYPASKAVFKDASDNINGTFVGNITGNVTGNASGSSGSTTGNAATATALETARTINGTSFDGTGNITVTAAAGTLTGSTLNSGVTASSLTSLGTLASNLNLGGQDIVTTASNQDIDLAAHGTGRVVIKGNDNAGALVLNCEANSHGQTILAAPHSAQAANTLRLPDHGVGVTTTSDLVSTTIAQTLTNKTIDSDSNTITNIVNADIKSSAAIANSKLANSSITVADGSSSTAVALGGTITFAGTSNEVEVGESSGTITVGLPNNVTIAGNLTVNGTTTTIDTTNTLVKDSLLGLNNGASSNSNDSGIIIERGSTGNDALLIWDESADKWALGTTTDNASSTGNLNMTTGTLVANIEGNVTGNVTGNVSGSSGSTTGNAATAKALATGRTIGMTGDVVWTSASFDGSGNVTGSATIQSSAVETSMINADAVTGAKIADDAIDSEHYTDGSIDTAHIAADAITGAKIADDAIDSEHYTDGSIDTAHIADDQVTQAKIADDAVGADQLASNAVVNASVASGAAIAFSKMENLTTGRALVSDGSGDVSVATTTSTEIGYVNGVTSAIQTQLDAKASAGFALAMAICL